MTQLTRGISISFALSPPCWPRKRCSKRPGSSQYDGLARSRQHDDFASRAVSASVTFGPNSPLRQQVLDLANLGNTGEQVAEPRLHVVEPVGQDVEEEVTAGPRGR